MCICEIKTHQIYVANNQYSSRFTKVDIHDIQACIEACSKDKKCGAFALGDEENRIECFLEDPSGSVLESIPNLSIMVKSSVNKCREDCPSDFLTLGLTGGCYYPVLDQTLNWEDAEAACQKLDDRAHLISLDNQEVRICYHVPKTKA